MQKLIDNINRLSEFSGRCLSWLVLVMVMIIVYDLFMRFFFQISSVALQELEWHLFALLFLLGAAYTLKHNAHVRVDVFYQSRLMDERKRAMVNIAGVIFFLFPFCLLVVISSIPFVATSFNIGEGSPDAGGLPYRFLLKAAIPLGFALLLLQGLSLLLESISLVLGRRNRSEEELEL